jgi:hypothetical protein
MTDESVRAANPAGRADCIVYLPTIHAAIYMERRKPPRFILLHLPMLLEGFSREGL